MSGIGKPVIVLVRPQLGQNIGKAARAMLNFGLTELRLVAPRDGWPNPDAGPSASVLSRSKENLTASAFSAAPLANFTFGRSLKVYVLPSSDSFQSVASRGPISVVPDLY